MDSRHIETQIKLLEYNNIYWKQNREMFLRLLEITKTSRISSVRSTGTHYHSKDNRDLMKWIEDSLPMLNDQFYTLATKIYWILNGLVDFPICHYEKCDNPKMIRFNVKTLSKGYSRFCCMSHCKKSEEYKTKLADNFEKKYGIRYCNTFQIPATKKKCEQSHLRNLGVKHPSQSKKIKFKKEQTMLKHYGVKYYWWSEEGKDIIKNSSLKRFGVDHPMKSSLVKEKVKRTNSKRYGVEHVFQSKSVKEKICKSINEHFGVNYSMQSPIIRQHAINNNRKKYKCDWPSQNINLKHKYHSKYFYNNHYFDSKPEIAMYIWLSDNHISFEYQPLISFTYIFNKKEKKYFPDFKIGERFIEIKGNHFFKNGKMICPFRKKTWTDEKYQEINKCYEAKHQCMIKNKVQIIMTSSICICQMMKYVANKYGKNYLQKFKVKK